MHDFDEYLVQGESSCKQKAEDWQIAIGLQAVDGLTPSTYLVQTAKRHIEGDISIDEVKDLIDTYYRTKSGHDAPAADTEEADKVSANITKLLNEQTFSFSPSGYAAVHKRIFDGVFKFAGRFRDCNITKKEWVLCGDTVLYVGFDEIRPALEHDFAREREFCYKGITLPDIIQHFVKFISGIWQIHAFREGNTRTTAVFAVKYLRSMGFKVDNKLFREYSWYFRNALVRANYRNITKGVEPEPDFLVKFFRNLLMGEQNELKNRYLLITPPQGFTASPPKYPPSTPQVPDAANLPGEDHKKLITAIGDKQLSIREMLSAMDLHDRKSFVQIYLTPAMESGFVTLLYPDKPQHPRQKYLLTVKGSAIYHELQNGKK